MMSLSGLLVVLITLQPWSEWLKPQPVASKRAQLSKQLQKLEIPQIDARQNRKHTLIAILSVSTKV